jgi:colanic acid/amylovoran biosynthesis glycosyltransferase
MVGRFVEKKGFVDGIEAFAQFVEGGGEGILNIVGDSDGSESSEEIKEQIIRAIEMHGLKDHVNLHGLLSPKELREHYYENHVLLVPSRTASTGDNEGGAPVTIIEAQSTGLPVIGTDHCDIPNLVKDGETGFIADEGDVSGLANIISHLYKEGGIDILGNRAKKFVEKKHDKKVVSSYIGSKYKNVKSKHG